MIEKRDRGALRETKTRREGCALGKIDDPSESGHLTGWLRTRSCQRGSTESGSSIVLLHVDDTAFGKCLRHARGEAFIVYEEVGLSLVFSAACAGPLSPPTPSPAVAALRPIETAPSPPPSPPPPPSLAERVGSLRSLARPSRASRDLSLRLVSS